MNADERRLLQNGKSDVDASNQSKPVVCEVKGTPREADGGLRNRGETGSSYLQNYHIVSLLDDDNLSERQYHGVTHVIQDDQSNQQVMDMIVLSELIDFLNDSVDTIKKQKAKYDA